jgi:hypothetical protein
VQCSCSLRLASLIIAARRRTSGGVEERAPRRATGVPARGAGQRERRLGHVAGRLDHGTAFNLLPALLVPKWCAPGS